MRGRMKTMMAAGLWIMMGTLVQAGESAEPYWPAFLPKGEVKPVPHAPVDSAGDAIVITQTETAGISGFRKDWDRPIVLAGDGLTKEHGNRFGKGPVAVWDGDTPGALAFDAVHRSLLIRFPGAAEAIAGQLKQGKSIARVELVLPFATTEFFPLGYMQPAGMSFLGQKWVKNPPTWHAIAWALRKPWKADAKLGPTFNAAINGALFWKKYGARDTQEDRFPEFFGPTEVSFREQKGYPAWNDDGAEGPDRDASPARMDVTGLLTDASFGKTLGERLRVLSDQGFLVRKWEIYDARLWKGGYEWSTATGPRGILIKQPSLRVVFKKTPAPAVTLPPAADVAALAETLSAEGKGGAPTALIPSDKQIQAYIEQYKLSRPEWMTDWQWQRVQELLTMGSKDKTVDKASSFPPTKEAYLNWIDKRLSVAPRRWGGWDVDEQIQQIALYRDALPDPVLNHVKLYWWAWLMPDRDAKDLVQGYVGGAKAQAYYKRTRDWRGNFSVYRTYCHAMGTMNFNHIFSMGTLFGGDLMGHANLVADGRHGLEYWPLRTWCWYDGSTQESIDHYYFAMSLVTQKNFSDFGPSHLDRMMGKMILAKSVEELISSFHPNLKRFISHSGRTGPGYAFATQAGVQHIVHTVSKNGALTDLDQPKVLDGVPTYNKQDPPAHIAKLTLTGPWAPAWMSALLDDRPLPYEMTVNFKQWGHYKSTPLFRRTYQANHYGLASQDVNLGDSTMPAMAMWRAEDKPVTTAKQVRTLLMQFGVNHTELLDSQYHGTTKGNPNGIIGNQGGSLSTLQHKNKMLILTSPYKHLKGSRNQPKEITSIQTTLGILNHDDTPAWEIYIDGTKVESLPAKAKMSSRIAIKDGVSYFGLVPVPATDLGRNLEVTIAANGRRTRLQGGGFAKEALRIDGYLYRTDPRPVELPKKVAHYQAPSYATPLDLPPDGPGPKEPFLDKKKADWNKIDRAVGGFVVEMGEKGQYADFAAFQKHLASCTITVKPAEKNRVAVTYVSGDDTFEVEYDPTYKGGPTDRCFPVRKVNGAWPYLPKGVERDSSCTVQASTGLLEKQGAKLECEKGKTAYLVAEPNSGTYAGFSPYPDPVRWCLSVPGGQRITPDGKIGILRAVVMTKTNRVEIDHAFRPGAEGNDLARSFVLEGFAEAPTVVLNGKDATQALRKVDGANGPAWLLPLGALTGDQAAQALPRAAGLRKYLEALRTYNIPATAIQDWYLCGPFPNPEGKQGFALAFPPEGGVDLKATYKGKDDKKVGWKRIGRKDGKPLGEGLINLQHQMKPFYNNATCYAYTEIESDADRIVTLLAGSDDTITIWVNGEKIWANQAYRGVEFDNDSVPNVKLKQGRNTILVKVTQGSGGWGFVLRVGDQDALPVLKGVRYGFGEATPQP